MPDDPKMPKSVQAC